MPLLLMPPLPTSLLVQIRLAKTQTLAFPADTVVTHPTLNHLHLPHQQSEARLIIRWMMKTALLTMRVKERMRRRSKCISSLRRFQKDQCGEMQGG